MSLRLFISFICLTFINNAQLLANDVVEFNVTEKENVFYIDASVVLHVPVDYVHGVLTDYVHIYRLNPSIVESEVLASQDDSVTRVRTKVIACFISFCREIERVEDVRILASGNIQVEIVPEFSQFKSGITLWQIQSMDESTRLTYHAEMEPDFFIPPIIGNSIVKAKLRDELVSSFTRLEKIAGIQSERDWNSNWVLTSSTEINKTRPEKISGMER